MLWSIEMSAPRHGGLIKVIGKNFTSFPFMQPQDQILLSSESIYLSIHCHQVFPQLDQLKVTKSMDMRRERLVARPIPRRLHPPGPRKNSPNRKFSSTTVEQAPQSLTEALKCTTPDGRFNHSSLI